MDCDRCGREIGTETDQSAAIIERDMYQGGGTFCSKVCMDAHDEAAFDRASERSLEQDGPRSYRETQAAARREVR